MHALVATLTTDAFLLVDDRSAPLRSEDGVQQGAPLATTSFCVATRPEDEERNNTLETTCKAARFDVDDGYFVGLPEHVNMALHASRTSIKASVGLEVSFGKMHAYTADMETVRREAPADIEWAEVDGDQGTSGVWTMAIPTARTVMTPPELREITAGFFFLPSPCMDPRKWQRPPSSHVTGARDVRGSAGGALVEGPRLGGDDSCRRAGAGPAMSSGARAARAAPRAREQVLKVKIISMGDARVGKSCLIK
eukprot:jgi/Tetstr1/460416/TSEL_005678.t1